MVKVSGALVAALIALFGVLLTGVINTYIAEQSRKLTAELEEQRAQEVALQTYLSDVGGLLLNRNLRGASTDSEVSLLEGSTIVIVSWMARSFESVCECSLP
jgi:hypothetical protein